MTYQSYPSEFEVLWRGCPARMRRCGKLGAFGSWRRAARFAMPAPGALLAVLERQARAFQWERDGGKYCPMLTTWINQGRWDVGDAGALDAPGAPVDPHADGVSL